MITIGQIISCDILHNNVGNHDKVYALMSIVSSIKEIKNLNYPYEITIITYAIWGRRGTKTYQVQEKNNLTRFTKQLEKYELQSNKTTKIINEKESKGYMKLSESDTVYKQVFDDMKSHLIIHHNLSLL